MNILLTYSTLRPCYTKTEDELINSLFVESLHTIPATEYYLDVLTFEPLATRQQFLQEFVKPLDEIEVKLDEYKKKYLHIGGDSLDAEDKHYFRRKADLDERLVKMYDKIEILESQLVEARAK